MMKIFISDAVVSRGYDGAPAIRLFNSENGGEFAVFQVGIRKYDSRAENNHRWVNPEGQGLRRPLRAHQENVAQGGFVHFPVRRLRRGALDGQGYRRGVLRRSSCLMTSSSPTPAGRRRNRTATARIREARASRATPQAPGAFQAAPAAPTQSGQTMQAPTEMPQNFTGYESFSGGTEPPSSRAEELEKQ